MNPQSNSSSPATAGKKPEGRPRTLDDHKRRQICHLTAEGLSLNQAARHVQCSTRTIRREMRRNPEFAKEIHGNEKFAQINPLSAMQRAIHHNWRAAAWLLERLFPERFARKLRTSAFGKRQVRQLLDQVLQIVREELIDTSQRERISGRLRAAFEYCMHVYCKPKRSSVGLRQAIECFELRDQQRGLVDEIGFPFPDLGDLLKPTSTSNSNDQAQKPKPTTSRNREVDQDLATLSEVVRSLLDELSAKPQLEPMTESSELATSHEQQSTVLSPSTDKTLDAACSTCP